MATAMSTPKTNGLPFTVAAGVELHGEIITWSCAGGAIRHFELVDALSASGLDPKAARDMLPRNAFARACRKLAEARIIRRSLGLEITPRSGPRAISTSNSKSGSWSTTEGFHARVRDAYRRRQPGGQRRAGPAAGAASPAHPAAGERA